MFDVLTNGFAAFYQVGCLLGGALCFGVGALLMGDNISKRLHGITVRGTLIGVRKKDSALSTTRERTNGAGRNDIYYPVYEYTMPTGETYQATSTSGSSGLDDKATGRIVDLLVLRDDPARATPKNDLAVYLFGLVFGGSGAFMLYLAATAWPITIFTGIAFAVVAGKILFNMRKIFIKILSPREQRGTLSEWKETKLQDMEKIPVMKTEEIRSLTATAAASKTSAPFFFVMGLVMVLGGGYLGSKTAALEANGIRSAGKVVDMEEKWSSDADSSSYTYYPIVLFQSRDGQSIRFKDRTGTNPPMYKRGEDVTVLYFASAPAEAVIDHGIFNWAPAAGIFCLGAIFMFVATKARRQAEKA